MVFITMKNDFQNFSSDQDWRLPIPRHHMIAICAILTVSLLTAVFLPAPNKLNISEQGTWTTGNLPDTQLSAESIIYSDDALATESIDSDPIPDELLLGNDEVPLSEQKQFEQEAQNSVDWYVQTVEKGDNINDIFKTLNIPYETLQALMNTQYGKNLADIHPGDKLYFLLSDKYEVYALIKPYNKTEQIRFDKDKATNNYFSVKENLNAHLGVTNGENTEVATISPVPSVDTPNAPAKAQESTVKANETIAKNKEKTQAKNKEQIAAEKKAQKEKLLAEAEKMKQESTPKINVRKKLEIIKVGKDENFITAVTKTGMTKAEAYDLMKSLRGRFDARRIHPGDEIRVLFSGVHDKRVVNAIYLSTKKQGKISIYRNPKDKKFYDESGIYSHNNGAKFRRYPIASPIRITSNFNPTRRHPITGKVRPHNGTDFGVRVGTPVFAPADGIVVKAQYLGAAGKYILIKHHGAYSTVYMHLSKILVKPGDKVKQNQRIALSGNTGASTGPHLHYEVRINNRPVNAMKVNLPNSGSSAKVTNNKEFATLVKKYKKELQIK